MNGSGLRFNEGKTNYELIPVNSLEKAADIFYFGSKKYGKNNWEKGMKWTTVISSLERHLQSIKKGEDYDKESNKLHISHLICNAMMLSEYYDIYPQGDDRKMRYTLKIGLDIDGVLADFNKATNSNSKYWNGSWEDNYSNLSKEFWENIEPLTKDIPFEPACYITSRHCKEEQTIKWLSDNNFPKAKVYHLSSGESKLESARKSGIDMFVDDRYENFVELNNNGIMCWLFDAPHNQKYNVGHKRIKSLEELSRFY